MAQLSFESIFDGNASVWRYHQIEQLKEEIKEKNQALVKQNQDKGNVTRSSDKIQEELEKVKKKHKNLKVGVYVIRSVNQNARHLRMRYWIFKVGGVFFSI